MVEGHSVHRIAKKTVGKRLVGRKVKATSPNKRCTEGAKSIDGRTFTKIEAIGKNLFAFFAMKGLPDVVMHVHFGMSGRWSIFTADAVPPTTPTTRIRIEVEKDNSNKEGLVSYVSAMTVKFGSYDYFKTKRDALGEDPLRADADSDALWEKFHVSKRTLGQLLMDQGFFAGVGNIYRAEICFVAGLHPNCPATSLSRDQFDKVWFESKRLMDIGFDTGRIMSVTPSEALALKKPTLRRYVYNQKKCGRCGGSVKSWQVNARTCYCCSNCQRFADNSSSEAEEVGEPVKVFNSHCASEPLSVRLLTPQKLTVAELKSELRRAGAKKLNGRKSDLVKALVQIQKNKAKNDRVAPKNLTVAELKSEIKRRGLKPLPGKKNVLVSQLENLLEVQEDMREHTADVDFSSAAGRKRKHGYSRKLVHEVSRLRDLPRRKKKR